METASGFLAPVSTQTLTLSPGMVELRADKESVLGWQPPLAVGPEDEVWLSGYNDHGFAVERVSSSGMVTGQFTIPIPEHARQGGLSDLSAASDGSVWFGDALGPGGLVGHITAAGRITEYHSTSLEYEVAPRVVVGSAGEAWFVTDGLTPQVGQVSAQGAESPGPTLEAFRSAVSIARDSSGDLWVADGYFPQIARIDASGGVSTFVVSVPLGGLALGPEGSMWFTEPEGGVGRITPAGQVLEFNVPSVGSSIVLGSDGDMWFGEPAVDGIGRITPSGSLTTFTSLPESAGAPADFAPGPNGDIWFTTTSGQLGRIVVPLTPVSTGPPMLSGDTVEGSVLASSSGGWSNNPLSFSYQWQRCDVIGGACVDVPDENTASVALSGADVSHTMRVVVTAANSAGQASVASSPTTLVRPAPVVGPESRTPVLGSAMTWVFRSYRTVEAMRVSHLPSGGTIEVRCVGHGCAFSRWHAKTVPGGTCRKRRCTPQKGIVSGSVELASLFRGRRLAAGARVSVTVTQAGFVGKRFLFTVHSKKAPSERVECLESGSKLVPTACAQ